MKASYWVVLGLPLWLLPWSTSLHEIAMGVGLGMALLSPRRGVWLEETSGQAALLLAVLWGLAGLVPWDWDGLGHAWLLAPFVVVPVLGGDLAEDTRKRVVEIAFMSWGLSVGWAVLVWARGGGRRGRCPIT